MLGMLVADCCWEKLFSYECYEKVRFNVFFALRKLMLFECSHTESEFSVDVILKSDARLLHQTIFY